MKKNHNDNCSREFFYVTRYLGSGVFNTIAGFMVIMVAMVLGFSPVASNIAGYAVGFILGFFLTKKFVFHSDGNFISEGSRYLIAFIVAFLFNLLVLQLALFYLDLHVAICQLIAAIAYTILMYLLTRFFVFGVNQ